MGTDIYRFVDSAGNAYAVAGATGAAYRMALSEHSHVPVTQWSSFEGSDVGPNFFYDMPVASYYVDNSYPLIWELDDARRTEELYNRYSRLPIDVWGGVVFAIAEGPGNGGAVQCVAAESALALENIGPVGAIVADTGSHMRFHSHGYSVEAFEAMDEGRNVYFGLGDAYVSDYGSDLLSDIEAMTCEQFDDAISTDSRLSVWSWVKWDGAEHCFYVY